MFVAAFGPPSVRKSRAPRRCGYQILYDGAVTLVAPGIMTLILDFGKFVHP